MEMVLLSLSQVRIIQDLTVYNLEFRLHTER